MIPLIPLLTAQAVAFWLLAPVMVLGALGIVLSKKPVHSALCLALVMISLAVQYASLDAPFLFVVQIIVYTGAVLMLFLFVLMLVGIDITDNLGETLKGHRVASVVAFLGFVALLVGAVGNAVVGKPLGLEKAHASQQGNVPSLAELIFTRYVFIFEATAALLITAALAAMVFAHGDQLRPKVRQPGQLQARMRKYASDGVHPGPLPSSGVYARGNAIHAPALLPDGSVSEKSIVTALADRGVVQDVSVLAAPTVATFKSIETVRTEEGEE